MPLAMLQACLNGGRSRNEHPRIPFAPQELAADARADAAAGAQTLHLHPRTLDGAETLAPDAVAAAIAAVRAACDLPVGVGTGAWIAPGGVARHAHLAAWPAPDAGGPDYASVNLNEPDAPEVVALLNARGIGVEAGIWTTTDAERFVAEISPADCLRILIEVAAPAPEPALQEARAIREILREGLRATDDAPPLLLHGEGCAVWPCVEEAALWGVETRVGFEDGLTLPDGAVAPDNAALVRAAAAYL